MKSSGTASTAKVSMRRAVPPALGARAVVIGRHHVARQQELDAAPSVLHQLAREVDLVLGDQRLPERATARAQEGVRHRAAEEQAVEPRQQVLDGLDLVLDLGAAEDREERRFGIGEQSLEPGHLGGEETPGGARLHPFGHAHDRRVSAMRGAERIVDVELGESRELRRELGIVLLSPA